MEDITYSKNLLEYGNKKNTVAAFEDIHLEIDKDAIRISVLNETILKAEVALFIEDGKLICEIWKCGDGASIDGNPSVTVDLINGQILSKT